MHRFRPFAVLVMLGAAILPAGAAEVPLGHPDFRPSPVRPVGFMGDGNGSFPGATLVDRFGDGPVEKVMVTYKDRRGRERKGKIPTLAKREPTNIAWTFDLPGFTQSQPIVVGDLAIQKCEPHSILGIDMHTGKLRWRYDADPFLLRGASEQEAADARALSACAWVLYAMSKNLVGGYVRLPKITDAVRQKLNERAKGMLSIAERAAAIHPKAAEESVARARKVVAWTTPGAELPKHKKGPEHVIAKTLNSIQAPLNDYIRKKYHCYTSMKNYTFIGHCWPAPVSDGEHVWTYMSQGQVVCLALDGTVRWTTTIDVSADFSVSRSHNPIPRSPLLVGDVLVVPWSQSFYGFDKSTGKLLWETDGIKQKPQSGFMPKVLRLESGREVIAAAVASMKGVKRWGKGKSGGFIAIIDPTTGKVLAGVGARYGAHDPGPGVIGSGSRCFWIYNGCAFQVREQDGSVSIEQIWSIDKGTKPGYKRSGNALPLHDGVIYLEHTRYRLDTGEEIPYAHRVELWHGKLHRIPVVVGNRLLIPKRGGRQSWEHGVRAFFWIADLNGKVLSRDNMLHYDSRPKVPWAEAIAQEMIDKGWLDDNGAGIPCEDSKAGIFAAGNRVLIPTHARLYCIGDPKQRYNGGKQ